MSPSHLVVVDTSGFPIFGDQQTPQKLPAGDSAASTMDAPSSEKSTVDHNSRRRKVRLATHSRVKHTSGVQNDIVVLLSALVLWTCNFHFVRPRLLSSACQFNSM